MLIFYGNPWALQAYVIYYSFSISARSLKNAKVQRTYLETICIPVRITPLESRL
jgi:hypothetical protein